MAHAVRGKGCTEDASEEEGREESRKEKVVDVIGRGSDEFPRPMLWKRRTLL
jgi:hypothetical protein